jgi:hypothetical protein
MSNIDAFCGGDPVKMQEVGRYTTERYYMWYEKRWGEVKRK